MVTFRRRLLDNPRRGRPAADDISAYEGTGTIDFRPHDDWNGQTTFDYVAIDNDNAEGAAGTATITVAPVNDAPQVIGFNPNRSVGESSVAGMALGHILADDPDGDSLTYSLAPESSDQFTINEFTGGSQRGQQLHRSESIRSA